MEGHGHVASQGQAADDGAGFTARFQDGIHVGDGLGFRERGLVRRVALPMAAHVPHDELVAVLERGDLAVPHTTRRAVAVAQQNGRAFAVDLVMNADPIPV